MQDELSPLSKIPQENNKFCKLNATDPKHVFEALSLPNDGGKIWSLNDIIENFGKKGLLCSKTVDKRKQCLRFRIDLDALAEADPHYKELMMAQVNNALNNNSMVLPGPMMPPPSSLPDMSPSSLPDMSRPPNMSPSTDISRPTDMSAEPDMSRPTETEVPPPLSSTNSSEEASGTENFTDSSTNPADRAIDTDSSSSSSSTERTIDTDSSNDNSISAENLNTTTTAPERKDKPSTEMLGGYQIKSKAKTIAKLHGGNDFNTPTTCVQKCLTENSPLKSEHQENTTKDLASSTKLFLVHNQIDKDERSTWEKLTSSSGGGGNKRTKKKGLKKYCLTKKRKGGKKSTTRRRKTKITLK